MTTKTVGNVAAVCAATPGNHPIDKPDLDDFLFTFSSSGSSTGNTLTDAFLSLFESLIQPLLTNLDPNLNPGEMNPVTSVIKATLTITITVPNKDGDGLIEIPINFSIDTSTIQPPFYSSGTTVTDATIEVPLTPTSASFAATLGLLLQLLNQLIQQLNEQVAAIKDVGL
jgi:hypothetical protein